MKKIGLEIYKTQKNTQNFNIKSFESSSNIRIPPLYKLFIENFDVFGEKVYRDTDKVFWSDSDGFLDLESSGTYPSREDLAFEFFFEIEKTVKVMEHCYDKEDEIWGKQLLPIASCAMNFMLMVGIGQENKDQIFLEKTTFNERYHLVSENIFDFVRGLETKKNDTNWWFQNRAITHENLFKNYGEDFWRFKKNQQQDVRKVLSVQSINNMQKVGFELFKTRNLNEKLDISGFEQNSQKKLPKLYRIFIETFIFEKSFFRRDCTLKDPENNTERDFMLQKYLPREGDFTVDEFLSLDRIIENLQSSTVHDDAVHPSDLLKIATTSMNQSILVGIGTHNQDKIYWGRPDLQPQYIELADNIFEFIRGIVLVPIEEQNLFGYKYSQLYKNWGEDFWSVRGDKLEV
jgi:hypothetical protein